MDSIEMLKELSLLIRNATKSGENTAERWVEHLLA